MSSLPSPSQVAGPHYTLFETWYKKLDVTGSGNIPAMTAAQFLKKSGLSDDTLSQIWDTSDPGGKGFLDKPGFFVALKLVSLVQNGRDPSLGNTAISTPPPNVGDPPPHPPLPKSVTPVPVVPSMPAGTVSSVWVITPADRQRYDQIFNTLGPEANKLHGNKVRGVMINSKLPTDILGKIWDMADMDKDGSLDRVEFSIAMHLVYKILENIEMPTVLPQEMLSSAQRAGVSQGPVPAPLAPPSQIIAAAAAAAVAADNKIPKPSGPPPAPWVVSAADKARYDMMFHNADVDKDGFVSGQEIKGLFLQSGLPQMVLAHIWNLCDTKQTGKLTSEQFALSMWLIQQKQDGIDPPQQLMPEMIPPTFRPKPTEVAVVPVKPTYNNPELQLVADEIDELNADKMKLEMDVQQKEASIRLKNNELQNLQNELDTLNATLRQLENQKGEAQKRLNDLGSQVDKLRFQVEEQEVSLKEQESEVMSKKQELDDLRSQEFQLEGSVSMIKKTLQNLGTTHQECQLSISQAKMKIEELQELERHMTEVLTSYDSAITSGDASALSESTLQDIVPVFNDQHYLQIGTISSVSPKESPKTEVPPTHELQNANIPKAMDTSFVGGHDPFATAFGGQKSEPDMFGVWDNKSAVSAPSKGDPFGGDAFGSDSFQDASPTPTLPPKKTKQPPPRPAPPKARPAKPPPPVFSANASRTDPSSAWTDHAADSGGFADFANFDQFDKMS